MGPSMDTSVHTLAATHSLQSKRSEVSSVLDDELFMKLVSNPAKYSYELQEIAKLLTSPPASRASSTTSRQKLRTIKHLVRDAISSYSTSEMDTSDTADEGVANTEVSVSEEWEANLSRLEHVSSRTIHKARKAKEQELRGEPPISPKPSILKTSSRASERAIDPATSLTGLKRVNFSSETINIDDGQPTQVSNIPDDYVVVEEDEISLATQELQQMQTASEPVPEARSVSVTPSDEVSPAPVLSSPTKSTMHVAYPYDQYIAGELAEPYTILQNQNESVSHSESAVSNRAGAASRVLTEMGIESELYNRLSYSHSLELKASLPSIPSYISGTESRNSISLRPNRPALESETGVDQVETVPSRGGLLSHSRASLNQVVPQDLRPDELDEEKRNTRSNRELPTPADGPTDPICVEEVSDQVDTQPHPPSRRNSLTLREHESRRQSLTQLSRISLVSKPSLHVSMQQQQQQPSPLTEEMSTLSQPEAIIEKQTSKSSLAEKASRIFSSLTSLVSLKGSGSKASQPVGTVAEQESNISIHANASNMSLGSKALPKEAKYSVSRSGSKQEEIQKTNSSLSKSGSKQEEIQKTNSSLSKSGSKQEEIQKTNSSLSKSGSKQEIQKTNSSLSKSGSKQEEIQKANSSLSKSGSKQEEIQKANSSMSKSGSKQEEIQKTNSSLSKSGSKQEEIQKANSVVSKSGSKQEEIQKTNSCLSKSGSKQEEIQKANSSLSKSGSKQEEIQKTNSSMSKSGSKQEEIQKTNSSLSKSGSKQEEIQKTNSSLSKSGSKQEEIQKTNSSMSKSGSKQEEIQKTNSSMSKSGSKQEEIQKTNSSLSKSGSKQEEIQKANSSLSKSGSKQEEIQKTNSSMSKSGSKQEEIEKANNSLSKSGSKQEEIQKTNSSMSKSGSKQEEIQKTNNSMSKSGSKQEEIQKANSSLSKSGSKQEEIQKTNSSMSKSGSKQEEIQKANSSLSKSGSKQEEIEKTNSSLSKSGSKQEEIQKTNSSMSKSGSKQEEIQKANSSLSKSGSKQEEIQKTNSSLSKSGSKQEEIEIRAVSNETEKLPQCDCTDCPDPTECTGTCTSPDPKDNPELDRPVSPSPEQGSATYPVDSSASIEAPVRIVLSPEVTSSDRTEEGDAEMGVVMKFSKEWKIVCTKECPDGVQETTITDWRDPTVDSEIIQVSQSSEAIGGGTHSTATQSLEGIELDSVEVKNQSSQINTTEELDRAAGIHTEIEMEPADTNETSGTLQQPQVTSTSSGERVLAETRDSLEQENRDTAEQDNSDNIEAPVEENVESEKGNKFENTENSVSEENKEEPDPTAPTDSTNAGSIGDNAGPTESNIIENTPEQMPPVSPIPELSNTEPEAIANNLSSEIYKDTETVNPKATYSDESNSTLQIETDEQSPISGEPQLEDKPPNGLPIDETLTDTHITPPDSQA